MQPAQNPQILALSIRQPWVTLILLGLKSIEIRQWSTPFRGCIYLHAGKIADDRPEGWALLPKDQHELTRRRGGVVGCAQLSECIVYSNAKDFQKDCQLHRNAPTWFRLPRLYGFRFEAPKIVPFHPCSGQVKFFAVDLPPLERRRPKTLPKPAKKLVKFEIDS